jgi:hypothetical protein
MNWTTQGKAELQLLFMQAVSAIAFYVEQRDAALRCLEKLEPGA